MGAGIIIPVVLLVVAIPAALLWAKKNFRDAGERDDDRAATAPSARLTSNALRELDSPPWRVVYEISEQRLSGVEHVLIGPAGTFALQTSMEPLPGAAAERATAHGVARSAIVRGNLDDALQRCAMSSDGLVTIHWGAAGGDQPISIELHPGHSAIDGRKLGEWADSLGDSTLSHAQIDLAWQTVLTAIGRPDPLS